MLQEVTVHDDLVAWAHKSHMRMSRSHVQQWQQGISHHLGGKTTGFTHYKQNCHGHMRTSDIEAMNQPTMLHIVYCMVSAQQANLSECEG